jgi:hypothetical protein
MAFLIATLVPLRARIGYDLAFPIDTEPNRFYEDHRGDVVVTVNGMQKGFA